MMRCRRSFGTLIVLVVVVLAGSLVVSAQSAVAAADAANFIGKWSIAMETPQGNFGLNLNLSDKGGKLVGEVSADVLPTQEITDISKAGEDLVLRYASDFQGQSFNVKITLSLSAADAGKAIFDAADGQFVMEGALSKAK